MPVSLGVTSPFYGGGQVPNPANVIFTTSAPAANAATNPGIIAVDTTNGNWYGSTNVGVWAELGGNAGPVDTLTASSGGAITPLAGTINLIGTANQITTAGAGHTLTWTIPATFIAPGSIASTSTLVGGTGITATTGNIVASAGNVTTTVGHITSATTLTATLGAITATNGNLVLDTAGNKILSTSVATTTTAGANSFGSVTLVGGTATIATTAVTANSLIHIWRQSIGATGAAALGMLSVGTITGATSFVINALQPADATTPQATDVSVIGWMIVN